MRAPRGPLLALYFACGCIAQRGYPCDDTAECVLGGVDGRCEPQGWCSYPDGECPSGWRFESHAPDDLAHTCVDVANSCEMNPCEAERLVIGDEHSCVIDGEGAMWCWGSNVFGQLGRGTSVPAERCPAPVVDLAAIELASASQQVCARGVDQRLSCWGHNEDLQVDWHDGVPEIVDAPREIVGLESVPAVIDVGPTLSCIANATTVTCWGRLPPGLDQPYTVQTEAPVTMLATGNAHVCALLVDGRVTCLGDDAVGQLGDGDIGPIDLPLVPSFPIDDAIAIDAGPEHTCALRSDDVVCWGANDLGQCGVSADQPAIALATSVVNRKPGRHLAVAAGGRHSCLLADDQSVQCWGDDASGQLGASASGVGAHTVLDADGEPLVAMEIGAGDRHTCARISSELVECWGDNSSLQLGAPSEQLTTTRHTLAFACD